MGRGRGPRRGGRPRPPIGGGRPPIGGRPGLPIPPPKDLPPDFGSPRPPKGSLPGSKNKINLSF